MMYCIENTAQCLTQDKYALLSTSQPYSQLVSTQLSSHILLSLLNSSQTELHSRVRMVVSQPLLPN